MTHQSNFQRIYRAVADRITALEEMQNRHFQTFFREHPDTEGAPFATESWEDAYPDEHEELITLRKFMPRIALIPEYSSLAAMFSAHLPAAACQIETIDGFDSGLVVRVSDISDETLGYMVYGLDHNQGPIPITFTFMGWYPADYR